jgi:hypothetical protein
VRSDSWDESLLMFVGVDALCISVTCVWCDASRAMVLSVGAPTTRTLNCASVCPADRCHGERRKQIRWLRLRFGMRLIRGPAGCWLATFSR